MNREQLRTILEEVMETGIADWRDYEGEWLSTKEYLVDREQNIEGGINMILSLLEKCCE